MSQRSELWHSARHDWQAAGHRGRGLLIVATCILLYEWSAGNETVTTLLITGLIREHRSVWGVLVAGLLAGGVLFCEQLLSGLVFLAAVDRLPGLVDAVVVAVRHRFGTDVPPYGQLPVVSRVGVSFVMGTSFVAVQDALAGERRRRRSIVISSATTAATVFVITGVIGGALIAADATALEGAVGVVYRIAGDWRFWLGMLLVPPLLAAAGRWTRRRLWAAPAVVPPPAPASVEPSDG